MAEKSQITPWWDPEDLRNYKSLIWNLTRRCNKNCKYCPFHDKTSPILTDRQHIWIAREIVKQFRKIPPNQRESCQISLFGGEPTTLRHATLVTCVATLSTIEQLDLLLYTNLTANPKQYAELINAGVTTVMASYHADNNTGYIGFVNKINGIAELGLNRDFHFLLMEDACKVNFIKDKLEDAGMRFDMFKPHRAGIQADEPKGKTVVDVDGWKKLVHSDHNGFKDWTCAAGYLHSYIECNGDVYPCQGIGHACYTGKLKREDWVRGNLLEDAACTLWDSEITTKCPTKACRFEVGITKYK